MEISGYRDILVAFDGSPHSERALDVAIELAVASHARLTILTAARQVPFPAYTGAAGTAAVALGRGHPVQTGHPRGFRWRELLGHQGGLEFRRLPLFRRRSKDAPSIGPPPAEMRGRAAEIADPGALGWEVVWEALKTEPPADDPASSTLTQELGLGEEREIPQTTTDWSATEFSGTRHGRRVWLRMGIVPSVSRERGANEVQVEAPVAPFRARSDDGRLVAEPGALPEVEEVFAGLAPAPDVWRDLEIEGGPDGILARRPITMKAHPQGYVYDLWLVEWLADRLGA